MLLSYTIVTALLIEARARDLGGFTVERLRGVGRHGLRLFLLGPTAGVAVGLLAIVGVDVIVLLVIETEKRTPWSPLSAP